MRKKKKHALPLSRRELFPVLWTYWTKYKRPLIPSTGVLAFVYRKLNSEFVLKEATEKGREGACVGLLQPA